MVIVFGIVMTAKADADNLPMDVEHFYYFHVTICVLAFCLNNNFNEKKHNF